MPFWRRLQPDFREVISWFSIKLHAERVVRLQEASSISAEILALPYIQSVEQQVGRAELSEDTWGPHRSEFHIELKPDADVDQSVAQEELRAILAKYPGIQSEVITFLGDRISESLSGETTQVAIKVFGDDLDVLDRTGDSIKAALAKVEGIVDLQFSRQRGAPALEIDISPQALSAAGLTQQQVLDGIEMAYAGANVGQTFSGTRTVNNGALRGVAKEA